MYCMFKKGYWNVNDQQHILLKHLWYTFSPTCINLLAHKHVLRRFKCSEREMQWLDWNLDRSTNTFCSLNIPWRVTATAGTPATTVLAKRLSMRLNASEYTVSSQVRYFSSQILNYLERSNFNELAEKHPCAEGTHASGTRKQVLNYTGKGFWCQWPCWPSI